MGSCGQKRTCGGMFSPSPFDSDWDMCETHAADLPHFSVIYRAQVDAGFSHRPVPETLAEAQDYSRKYLQGLPTIPGQVTVGPQVVGYFPSPSTK